MEYQKSCLYQPNIVIYYTNKKTKYYFFHKASKRDNIPFDLPKLYIGNNQVQQFKSI